MQFRFRKWLRRLLATLVCVLSPMAAHAHPHAWIDLQSTIVFNTQGRITGLTLNWNFDEFYSLFMMEELDAMDKALAKRLLDLTASNLSNLREFDYFTVVLANGHKVALADVTQFDGGARDGRYWMRFTIPLETPIDPRTQAVSFAVFDPTYYIDITYTPDSVVSHDGAKCRAKIIAPNPSADVVDMAAALDRTETAGNDLGIEFAQSVSVSCS